MECRSGGIQHCQWLTHDTGTPKPPRSKSEERRVAEILVVDDDELIRDMIRGFLEARGHTVTEADDGRKAVQHLLATPANLCIIDVVMPNQEGLETIRKIRRAHPGMAMIAISGGGSIGNTSYLEAAAAFGAQATLQKPFSPRDLIEAVDRLLAG